MNNLLKVGYSMELLDQVREVFRKKHYSIQYSERNMGDRGI